ncbi:MAG: PAC2 family protein [Candidatus Nanopelagicales bacterium]
MSQLDDLPALVDPVMVAAFEGWNDAGDSASDAVEHLRQVWDAQPLVEMDSEEYYDYQVNRPHVSIDETGVQSLEWPATRIFVARPPLFPRDIVLVQGIEPNMKWQQFVREVLGLATELQVSTVVTLGALLSDIPHTRPVPVTGTCSDPTLGPELGLEPSTYEGPTGIVGVIQEACTRFGLSSVSLWAAVPHYVAQPPCPKATLALIRRIEDILDVPVPLGDLVEEARAWEIGVDELAAEDDEVADYVKQLEEARDATDLPEASGEAIAREFERYLRRRGADDPKQP